jgi:hypothetical protein
MIKDLIKVEDRVRYLLEKYHVTRDSDKQLWLAYGVIFCDLSEKCNGYKDFKEWLLQDDVPVFESLSRARRKIMETNILLRGETYKARQEESEAVREWSKM